MVDAFLYLSACSFKNRIRARVRRLREPRYLIGLIVGMFYLYFAIFRGSFVSRRSRRGRTLWLAGFERFRDTLQFLGSLVLFALVGIAWIFPGSRQGIQFTRPEVQFLFTAPLTRRQLLHYKLLRSQLATFFGSAIATVFLRPGALDAGLMFLTGMWLMFSTMSLHFTGVSLSRESLTQHGRSGLRRQWMPGALVLGALIVLGATVAADWPRLSTLPNAGAVVAELRRISAAGPAWLVLWPFRTLVRLPLARTADEYWAALPGAILLLVLNYVWVLRSDASFEEASAEQAEQRAQLRATPRAVLRGTATPFALAAEGRPETAILWKNLIMLGRYASLKMLIPFVWIFLLFGVAASRGAGRTGLGMIAAMICLVIGVITILLGPQMMRNDLRQDLASLAVLKTWPIRGAVLLRGEALAPAVVLTVIAWVCLASGAVLLGNGAGTERALGAVALNRLSYTVAAMLVAPAMILAQIVVQNGAAVLFPAWVSVGPSRPRGIDAMGQRLLMVAGMLVLLVVSLLPAAIVAGLIDGIVYWFTGTILIVLPAAIIAIVVMVECVLAIEGLGRILDRTDVTALSPVE